MLNAFTSEAVRLLTRDSLCIRERNAFLIRKKELPTTLFIYIRNNNVYNNFEMNGYEGDIIRSDSTRGVVSR